MKPLRILKNIFLGLLLIFGALGILVFVGLQWPELWLKNSTLNFAKKQLNQSLPEVQLQWESIQAETTRLGFLSHRVLISAKDFCFVQERETRACFESIELGFAYSLPKLKVLELGPALAEGGEITFHSKEEDSETVKLPELPGWLESAVVRKVNIDVSHYDLQLAENSFEGSLRLTSEGSFHASGFEVTARLQEKQWGEIEMTAISQSQLIEGPWYINSDVDLNLPGPTNLRADISLHFQEDSLKALLNGKISGKYFAQFNDCSFFLKRTPLQRASLAANCEVLAPLSQFQDKNIKVLTRSLRHPRLGSEITLDLESAYPFETKNTIAGQVRVRPFSNFEDIVTLQGGLTSDFAFVPEDLPKMQKLEGKLDLLADIIEFKNVVALGGQSRLAVPAPFHVLTGPIRFISHGSFNNRKAKIESALETQLASEYQRLVTRSNASVSIDLQDFQLQKVFVNADIDLRQIRLVLPPIETNMPAQLFPDQRIVHQKISVESQNIIAGDPKGLPLKYDLLIRTPKEKPIRLVSSATERPVAFGVRMKMTEEVPFRGAIKLKPIHYSLVGIQGTTGGLSLRMRGTEHQMIARGLITNTKGEARSRVLIAQDPSDSLARPEPKLPIPVVELVTALGFKKPFSLVVLDQRRPNPPQTNSGFGTVPVEIQRRY